MINVTLLCWIFEIFMIFFKEIINLLYSEWTFQNGQRNKQKTKRSLNFAYIYGFFVLMREFKQLIILKTERPI